MKYITLLLCYVTITFKTQRKQFFYLRDINKRNINMETNASYLYLLMQSSYMLPTHLYGSNIS